ncbi:DUF4355 domain-containing protein [Eubacterium limosum]|uniref:DUF4355 domain-containing protein n=1 Tax=Eubacterium limosum TaxID=1736 RepID=UPI001D0601C7|nr:DUF4355 domain-containing protein [Eubacterium limosum]MCB6571173.1 DUF4355 domain-containing protein [Eubacterium limosum]
MFYQENEMIPMNLQLFAEDAADNGGDGAGEGIDNAAGAESAPEEKTQEKPPKTFEEILSNKDYQAEFDRRVQKALETQRSKLEVLFDEKATEAEKLAKMTEKEKAQYLQQKKEKEMADREAAITKRELAAEAKNTLAEKKLPVSLAEVLNYSNADACKQSIEAVEKAFKEAVEASVEERLKGDKPPKKAPSQDDADLAKQVENLMMGKV